MIPAKKPNYWIVVRTTDGSPLGQLNAKHITFIYNFDRMDPDERPPDITPTGLLDKVSGKVFDASLPSLMSFGLE